MARPYATELQQLDATYAWAATTDIDDLVAAVSSVARLPLIAVGSGGSLSAAYHAIGLHQECTGLLSKPVTPLELVRSPLYLGVHGVLLLSAGGTNADIIGSLRNVIEREPRRCIVLCFRPGSALSELAAEYGSVQLVEMSPPVVKDGFLSTNSLLAFAVLLERAYARAFGAGGVLADTLSGLLPSTPGLERYIDGLRIQCKPLWDRETVLVLHGPAVHAAAVDLESKFSEAALGNVQVADLRNFAHGRHNWLAKRAHSTGVLALYSDPDRKLAEATLRLLPSDVPVARADVHAAGAASRIAALVAVLHIVGECGNARNLDPGRPHVPRFGRQIYHLKAFSTSRSARLPLQAIAIARKVAVDAGALATRTWLTPWVKAYRDFVTKLGDAAFGAILFDYDGTLCDGRDRFVGMRDEVAAALKQLLAAQISIGVATGRGKSVRDDLRRVLPESTWDRVLVGYYNCTDIAQLTDSARPNATGTPVGPLLDAAEALSRHPILAILATIDIRPSQISLQCKSVGSLGTIWRTALDIIQSHSGLTIVRSSHSVDILAQGDLKTGLLKVLGRSTPQAVLCIGDMGRWPGNDHAILASEYSLSVDEVSMATGSCWNLAPAGVRGVHAALHYLKCLVPTSGVARLDMSKLTSTATRSELE